MKKNIFACVLFLIASVCSLCAEQITKFAVVDTSVVYQTYFRESTSVRAYETQKAEFQAEINNLTAELKALQLRKVEAQKNDDQITMQRLDAEITQKSAYLTEYARAKNIKLDDMKKRLQFADDFYSRLYTVIGRIAESEGYSMVLSLQQADSVLWYSTSVDITNLVIEELSRDR